MIYLTGDTHGDLERFQGKEARQLKRGDTLLICGDFGFVWDGSKQEEKALKWLSKRRYTVLFVEGTHDNLALLSNYPEELWNGGKTRRLADNIRLLQRGEIFQLENNYFFAMGGGESDDLDIREEGRTWWPQEMPTAQELDSARQNLARYQNVVDYIITHQCSANLLSFLSMDRREDEMRINPLNTFFNEVERGCRFKGWFFGCYHLDKKIPPRHQALFQRILPLG